MNERRIVFDNIEITVFKYWFYMVFILLLAVTVYIFYNNMLYILPFLLIICFVGFYFLFKFDINEKLIDIY